MENPYCTDIDINTVEERKL